MTEFDNNKTYTWTPEDKFELTGEQFGLLINTLRMVQSLFPTITQSGKALEDVLAKSVGAGGAKETTPIPSPPVSNLKIVKSKNSEE